MGDPVSSAILVQILISVGVSVGLYVISKALFPNPDFDPNAAGWQGRITQRNNPTAPRDIVYGEVRKSGVQFYTELTEESKFLHIIIGICQGPVHSIPIVFLDDQPIYEDEIDSEGMVTEGRFANKARIKKYLGTPEQTADPSLVADSDEKWTDDHRLRGICYLYLRLEYDREVFSTVPNISGYIRGRPVDDIRISGTNRRFSTNPINIAVDYMTRDEADMGLGFKESEIADFYNQAAANTCDEYVTTAAIEYTIAERNGDTSALILEPKEDTIGFSLLPGDRVTVGGGVYYVSLHKPFLSENNEKHQIRLASSPEEALIGGFIGLSIVPSGTTVTKTGEPRYSCSGIIESNRTPRDNLADIMSSIGGKAVYSEGEWKLRPAIWEPGVVVFDEGDLIGPVKIQTKSSIRQRFNAVKGQFFSLINLGVPAEYPEIVNSFYQGEDGGKRIFTVLNLPFTYRPHTCQRLAKIHLERHRQAIIWQGKFKLSALISQPGDVVLITIPRMGWEGKEFEVIEWEFIGEDDDNGIPVFSVDMTLQETAAGVFAWNSGEETTYDLAPNTNLNTPFNLTAVTGISISFITIITEDGSARTDMRVCWSRHPNPSVVSYSMEYRIADSGQVWIPGGSVNSDLQCITVHSVEPGVAYEVRVRARNAFGYDGPYGFARSDGVSGDRDAPGPVTNAMLEGTPGGYNATWVNPPDRDLDVVEVWEKIVE